MSTQNKESRKGAIERKTYAFSIRVVNLYKYLCKEKHEYVLSKQLMRSGTSVGAMVREAQNAESRADFIHKLGIGQKECDESLFWLSILKDTDFLDEKQYESISLDATEILKMIRSAIVTSKAIKNGG